MLNYINEAFKQLDLLTESVFDTSEASLTDLSTFVNNDDEVEQITVINDEFDNEDNIPDPKVGDLILNCNICHSLIFKNKDDITIDENGDVNKDYPCPRCGETDGYTIVGEIQEFKPEGEEEVEPVADETPVEEPTEEITESLKENIGPVINMTDGTIPSFDDPQWRQNAYNLYRFLMQDSAASYLDDFAFMTGIEFEDDDEEEEYIQEVQERVFEPIENVDEALTILKRDYPQLYTAAKNWMVEIIEDEPEMVASGMSYVEWDIRKDDEEEDIDESLNEASNKTPWDIIIAAYPELNNITEEFDNEAGVKAWSANAIKAYKQAAQNLGLTDFNMTTKGYGNSITATISFKKNGKVMSKEVDPDVTHVNSVQDAVDFLQYTFNDELMEALKESFNNVSIETETDKLTMTSDNNGKVTVTTEPITNDAIAEEGAVIAPVSDETQDAIISANAEVETEEGTEDEMMDFDFDEVDEASFDELGESYLKRVYENVNAFKTTKVSTTPTQLIVEGLISFKSGVTKNTGFIFEAKDATKNGRLRFIGENKHFSRGNKAFTLVGSMNESKKLICESFTYNYRAKTPAGKATRVYGTVSCKK